MSYFSTPPLENLIQARTFRVPVNNQSHGLSYNAAKSYRIQFEG